MQYPSRTTTLARVAAIAAAFMLLAGSSPARAQSPPGFGSAPARGASDPVLLVTTLGDDKVNCARPAPSIRWSQAGFNRYKVFVGTDLAFASQITSGATLLSTTTWTIPATKWATLCSRAPTHLYIKVMGTVAGTEEVALSNVDAIKVK